MFFTLCRVDLQSIAMQVLTGAIAALEQSVEHLGDRALGPLRILSLQSIENLKLKSIPNRYTETPVVPRFGRPQPSSQSHFPHPIHQLTNNTYNRPPVGQTGNGTANIGMSGSGGMMHGGVQGVVGSRGGHGGMLRNFGLRVGGSSGGVKGGGVSANVPGEHP